MREWMLFNPCAKPPPQSGAKNDRRYFRHERDFHQPGSGRGVLPFRRVRLRPGPASHNRLGRYDQSRRDDAVHHLSAAGRVRARDDMASGEPAHSADDGRPGQYGAAHDFQVYRYDGDDRDVVLQRVGAVPAQHRGTAGDARHRDHRPRAASASNGRAGGGDADYGDGAMTLTQKQAREALALAEKARPISPWGMSSGEIAEHQRLVARYSEASFTGYENALRDLQEARADMKLLTDHLCVRCALKLDVFEILIPAVKRLRAFFEE